MKSGIQAIGNLLITFYLYSISGFYYACSLLLSTAYSYEHNSRADKNVYWDRIGLAILEA